LSAQPNAGRPRDVEGRTIYLTSPEYMASYTRRFADRGVRLVGGCCGTTPEHIAQMRSALSRLPVRAGRPAGADSSRPRPASSTVVQPSPHGGPAEGSALSRTLAARGWVRVVELAPPRGHDIRVVVDRARQLRARGLDAVHVPDGWSGPRLSALALAVLVRQQAGIEVVLQYASRDKPLLGLQSELLGAYAMGVRHILAVTGEARHAGDYADATAVVDVDSIGLVNAVSRLNQGLDVGGQTIGDPTSFHLGVTVNPAAEDMDG
jgi:homocysteine S-methyltransferase